MRQTLFALAIVAATALGCGKNDVGPMPMEPMWLYHPGNVLSLEFRVQLTHADGVLASGVAERSVPAIDHVNRRLFVGTTDKGFYAVSATDGNILWRYETVGIIESEALYDPKRDIVFFGTNEGALYALNARDGSLRFRFEPLGGKAEINRKPILIEAKNGHGPILGFVNAADCVFALNADTGATLWLHQKSPSMGLEIAGHAGISHDDSHIFAAFSTGKVAAYDIATGTDRWPDIELVHPGKNGEEQIYFDVDTTPLVVGDEVYFGSAMNGVYALNVESGQELWHRSEAEGVSWLGYFEDAVSTDPAIASNKLVLAGSGLTGLWALDPKTGEVRWRKKVPSGNLAHPVAFGGGILISSSKFGLFFLHANSGDVIDGINPGPGVDNAPAVYGNRAFLLSKSGVLFGLALQIPRTASESSPNVINSSPAYP